jgi:hypothetical protein
MQRREIIVKDDDWEKSGDGVLEGDAIREDLELRVPNSSLLK